MTVARTHPSQRDYLAATPEGVALLATLEARIAALETRWDIRIGGPAGKGATSVALRATGAGGQELVVKFEPVPSRLAEQAAVMYAWGRIGLAPEVLHISDDAYAMAYLDVPTVPRPLADGAAGVTEFCRVGEVLEEAWGVQVEGLGHGDKHDWVFATTERRLLGSPAPILPVEVVARAREVLVELRSAGSPVGLCHGDTVGGNVLMGDGGQRWLLDPIPHYDPLVAVLASWAVRARDGYDIAKLLTTLGPRHDRDAAEAWAACILVTYVVYRWWRGQAVDAELLDGCKLLL